MGTGWRADGHPRQYGLLAGLLTQGALNGLLVEGFWLGRGIIAMCAVLAYLKCYFAD